MEKFNKIKDRGLRIAATVSSHHTGAFAAQAAYFFVLSLIPIFMLLLPSRKSMYVYFFVPCGNYALIGAFRIR